MSEEEEEEEEVSQLKRRIFRKKHPEGGKIDISGLPSFEDIPKSDKKKITIRTVEGTEILGLVGKGCYTKTKKRFILFGKKKKILKCDDLKLE